MFKTNQYFGGKVVSIGLESAEGTATVGVMAAGEYEFGTATIEISGDKARFDKYLGIAGYRT